MRIPAADYSVLDSLWLGKLPTRSTVVCAAFFTLRNCFKSGATKDYVRIVGWLTLVGLTLLGCLLFCIWFLHAVFPGLAFGLALTVAQLLWFAS